MDSQRTRPSMPSKSKSTQEIFMHCRYQGIYTSFHTFSCSITLPLDSQRVRPFSSMEVGWQDRLSALPKGVLSSILAKVAGEDLVCIEQVKSVYKLSLVSRTFGNMVAETWGWPIVVMQECNAERVLHNIDESRKPDISVFTEPIIVLIWTSSSFHTLERILYRVQASFHHCKCQFFLRHPIRARTSSSGFSDGLVLPDMWKVVVDNDADLPVDIHITNTQSMVRLVVRNVARVVTFGICSLESIEGGGAEFWHEQGLCPRLEHFDGTLLEVRNGGAPLLKYLIVRTTDSITLEDCPNLENIIILEKLRGSVHRAFSFGKVKMATVPCPCNIQDGQGTDWMGVEEDERARTTTSIYKQLMAQAAFTFNRCGGALCEENCHAFRSLHSA